MKTEPSKSLMEEFNLEKIEYKTSEGILLVDYKFKDYSQQSGHLMWPYRDGIFGLAKYIYFNHTGSNYRWGYVGSIELSDENQIRHHLSYLRTSIINEIKNFKKTLLNNKLSKMKNDFV